MTNMVKLVNKLATVLADIILNSNTWNTLYDSYLSDEEIEKHKLGFSYGFTLDYQDAREVIIAKFKPSNDYPATQALKQYWEEETNKNYFKVMKYSNLGKLIPIFETVEDKQVLKMLILRTNF